MPYIDSNPIHLWLNLKKGHTSEIGQRILDAETSSGFHVGVTNVRPTIRDWSQRLRLNQFFVIAAKARKRRGTSVIDCMSFSKPRFARHQLQNGVRLLCRITWLSTVTRRLIVRPNLGRDCFDRTAVSHFSRVTLPTVRRTR